MKKIINLILIAILVLIPIKSMATDTGHSKTVQITAKPGYQVTDVIVNGESKGPLTSYTFSDVLSPQSLEVITEAIGYKVTFDANGGEGTMEDQVFSTISGKLNKNAFMKDGYVFNGWSTTADGEVEYQDEDVCFLLEDKTLYAVWGLWGDATGDGIVDIYDAQLAQRYAAGEEVDINLINADVDQNGIVNDRDSSVIQYAITNPVTLPYSGWIIRLRPNDTVIFCENQEEYTLPSESRRRPVSYWISDKYPDYLFESGETWNVSEDDEFTAIYEGYGIYTIKFDSNGGEGTMSPQAFFQKVSKKLNANTFSKSGYAFLGWSTTSDGEVEYEDEDIISITETELTLYAVWGLYGDATGDGTISLADGTALSAYIQEHKSDKNLDVNQDGFVDELDLYLVNKACNGDITLPYTGKVVYNDAGILQLSDTSFDYTIAARTDANNGDVVGYFVNEWGGQYKKVGDTITISSNTELLPVWSEVMAGGSSDDVCLVTITSISTGYSIKYNGTALGVGVHEIPVGDSISCTIVGIAEGWTHLMYDDSPVATSNYNNSSTKMTHTIPVVRDLRIDCATDMNITGVGSIKWKDTSSYPVGVQTASGCTISGISTGIQAGSKSVKLTANAGTSSDDKSEIYMPSGITNRKYGGSTSKTITVNYPCYIVGCKYTYSSGGDVCAFISVIAL